MKYPLILSDFDGTLLRSDRSIGERTKKAIARHVERGGIFAVCTGRTVASILPEVRSFNLSGLVVSFNGAVITDIRTGEHLRFDGFLKRDAVSVCEKLEEIGVRIHAYSADTLYTNYRDRLLAHYERVCRIQAVQVEKMSEFLRNSTFLVHKIVVMIEEEKQQELFLHLKELLGEDFYVTTSASILIEISPKGQNKGSAVDFLCDHYGLKREQSLALGDQLNDLPMLTRAGMGVAVRNAVDALKKSADLVTVTNDEDAVGVIIENYGMGEKQENE